MKKCILAVLILVIIFVSGCARPYKQEIYQVSNIYKCFSESKHFAEKKVRDDQNYTYYGDNKTGNTSWGHIIHGRNGDKIKTFCTQDAKLKISYYKGK